MAAKQAMKENLQCTSKYGHLRISQDICHVRMTDIEGFLTIYGHSDNLLNNNHRKSISVKLWAHSNSICGVFAMQGNKWCMALLLWKEGKACFFSFFMNKCFRKIIISNQMRKNSNIMCILIMSKTTRYLERIKSASNMNGSQPQIGLIKVIVRED